MPETSPRVPLRPSQWHIHERGALPPDDDATVWDAPRDHPAEVLFHVYSAPTQTTVAVLREHGQAVRYRANFLRDYFRLGVPDLLHDSLRRRGPSSGRKSRQRAISQQLVDLYKRPVRFRTLCGRFCDLWMAYGHAYAP